MAKRDQQIAMEPAMSPSEEEKAYAAEVASRKKRARKTKIFVQIPAGSTRAFTPNASKAVRRMRTVVNPW